MKSGGLELYSIHGAWNLLGASSDDPPTVLILLRSAADAPPPVGLPTVSTGAVTPVSHDPVFNQDLQMDRKLSSKLLGENMNHHQFPMCSTTPVRTCIPLDESIVCTSGSQLCE